MKTKQCMIYKDVVNKRLARKREQVSAILELENVIDIAESMFTAETCDQNEKK